LLSGQFFRQTYLFNRASAVDDVHWAWMASLRYLMTLPLLLPLMPWQGGAAPVLRSIAAHPMAWLRYSAVGFVVFYCLLAFAASSGPSWLVAGSFMFTVIAGMLCAPFIYRDARWRACSEPRSRFSWATDCCCCTRKTPAKRSTPPSACSA